MVATSTTDNVTTTDRRTVIGVFEDVDSATQALNALRDAGFTPEQVSVVARDTRTTREMAENTDMVAEDAARGRSSGPSWVASRAGWSGSARWRSPVSGRSSGRGSSARRWPGPALARQLAD